MLWEWQYAQDIGLGDSGAEIFLDDCCHAGWEPFSVTRQKNGGFTYHLRKGLVLA